jgi:hypothetical protein
MKNIEISTDVFARIWSLRREGELTEDDVLRRVLWQGRPLQLTANSEAAVDPSGKGLVDRRFGVLFPEGFEILRTYLGQQYRAQVVDGYWRLDGRSFTSLNELSRSIGAKTENAWMNWLYRDTSGALRRASELRSQNQSETEKSKDTDVHRVTWVDDVVSGLSKLGGKASLGRVYAVVEEIRRTSGRTVPRTFDAVVRRTLEEHSSDSEVLQRGPDLFWMPEGKGAGIWALRSWRPA